MATIRAFRIVAASLNASVAQPAWPDALLARLTTPLPLVDCDPLSAWAPTSATETAATPSVSNPKSSKVRIQARHADQSDQRVAVSADLSAARTSAKPFWSNNEGERLPSASQRDRRPPDRRNSSTLPQLSDPTVPSRPQRETAAPRFNSLRPPSPSPDDSHPWPDLQSQAASPLTALAEIGRLTGEILARNPAPGSPRWAKNGPESAPRPPQPAPEALNAKTQSQVDNLSPSLTAPSSTLPLSPPPPSLNLASLAALYAGASSPGSPDLAPSLTPSAQRDFPPTAAISNTASTTFSTPALADVSDLEATLPDLSGDGPGPSGLEVAETLTEMVSAILQAQAQRHGVDLS